MLNSSRWKEVIITARIVAIYGRVSTEHEAQLSALDNQIQYYDDILDKHPDWELYDRYIDEGITGTSTKKRKNFLRMMEDARRGCFDLIITREVSRFARNTVDTLQETRKLKKWGVEVYFTEDNIWTFNDEDGELKLTLMATLAQNESKKTSQRVKAGQMISFQNGVFYGTGNIMGYDKIGKEMVINEEQAKVVRLIFDLFLEGYGTQKIKYELEKREILTATGLKVWSASQIGRMLKNAFYCGTIVYRKYYVPDYLEQKPKKNNGAVEQVIVEGTHQPIISKEDFEKVQKLLETHSMIKKDDKKIRVGVPQNIWSSKVVCECGASMNKKVYSRRNEKEVMYGYICYNQKNKGSANKRIEKGLDADGFCDIPQIQEWKFDLMSNILFDKILNDKERIKDLAYSLIDKVISEDEINNEIQDKILSIEKKISNNTEKKNRLLDGYLNGLIEKKDFVIKKKEIEDAYQNLVLQLEDLKSQSTPSTCEIKERIKKLKQTINENLNFDENCIPTEIINSFIEKITVHKDKFEWKLNYLTELNNYIGDIPIEDKSIHLATIVINRDDIIRYNEKHNCLKRICQKENIIMEVYI